MPSSQETSPSQAASTHATGKGLFKPSHAWSVVPRRTLSLDKTKCCIFTNTWLPQPESVATRERHEGSKEGRGDLGVLVECYSVNCMHKVVILEALKY